MLLFGRERPGTTNLEFDRAVRSLSLFSGHSAAFHKDGGDGFAQLTDARPAVGWRVTRGSSGSAVLFHGWIDNIAQLRRDLDLRTDDPARLYVEAVERWGARADSRVIGSYAAIVALPDNALRLSRSPWDSFPLFYVQDETTFLACSITRPIFAAGVPKRLRFDAAIGMLCIEFTSDTQSMFEGISQVPQGSILTIDPSGAASLDRWYDPVAGPDVRLARDEDYVEAANALIAESVESALRHAKRPGMSLSGGLDSSIVCAEMLRQLPEGQRLPSFTFRPVKEWDGKVDCRHFGDDRPYVEAYAAMHPKLDPTYVDNAGIGFDDRAERMFLACDMGHPSRVLGSVYHGVMDAAREKGCDWVFSAALGNWTFSNDATWATSEFFRTGRWRQLWKLVNSDMYSWRTPYRRIVLEAIIPELPPGLQKTLRRAHRRWRGDAGLGNPFLSDDPRVRAKRDQENIADTIATVLGGRDHETHIRQMYVGAGSGAETGLGYEQVFGLKLRDITAYRPLIEFCNRIPTDQFVRDGETRYLARRMGIGKLPEAQRTNQAYGEHNVDWHARMTPVREELRQQVEAVARHPDIGPLVDTDRMLKLFDKWPESTPDDEQEAAMYRFYMPSVLYVTKYVDAMTGRNG